MKLCQQCGQPMASEAAEGLCARCLLSAAVAATPSPSASGGPPVPSSPGGEDFPDIGDAAEIARRFPQYEILGMLGRGGMGVVYKARQVQLDRLVALKILPPLEAMSPDFVERFRREARSLAKLSHPNIVAVHDFGESHGLYYFAMEFVDGVNLREMILTGQMKPEEALAVVPKICDALQFAHEEGVVHRDVKPENILIDKRGRVKIADFGLAKLLRRDTTDHTLTQTGMTLGTPRYMAPEQLDRPETVDHRADIYSLGVVFYEMLTGEVPMGRFAPPSEKVQVDVKLDEIVLRSLERDVERRYQHASEVRDDVEKVTSKPGAPAPAPAATSPAGRGDPESRMIAMLVFAVLFLVAMIGCFVAGHGITRTIQAAAAEKMRGGSLASHWVAALVFGAMLVNTVIALVMLIKAKAKGRDKLARMGALNLVCAGMLLTIACGEWFDVPGFVGSIYMVVAIMGWIILRKPAVKAAFASLADAGSPPPQVIADATTPTRSLRGCFIALALVLGIPAGMVAVYFAAGKRAPSVRALIGAGIAMREDRSRVPTTRTPGRTDYAYSFAVPANHRLFVWLEWWKDSKRTIDQNCNTGYVANPGQRYDAGVQIVFTDGNVAGPTTAGQTRIDWIFYDPTGHSTSGKWRPEVFAGMTTTTSWGEKSSWTPKVGETVTLLAIGAGKDSVMNGPFTDERLRAGHWQVAMLLKARVEPVPASQMSVAPFTKMNAWNDNEDPSPALLRLGEQFGAVTGPFATAANHREQIAYNIKKDAARAKAEQMLRDAGAPASPNAKPEDLVKALENSP